MMRMSSKSGLAIVACLAACSETPTPTEPSLPAAKDNAAPTDPSDASSHSERKLAVGDPVIVGAGFVFQDGVVADLECSGDGSVVEGAPCIVVTTNSATSDTALALVSPVKGHTVDAPAPDAYYICGEKKGESLTWSPCRTVGDGNDVQCEVAGAISDCSAFTVVDVKPNIEEGIDAFFSEQGGADPSDPMPSRPR